MVDEIQSRHRPLFPPPASQRAGRYRHLLQRRTYFWRKNDTDLQRNRLRSNPYQTNDERHLTRTSSDWSGRSALLARIRPVDTRTSRILPYKSGIQSLFPHRRSPVRHTRTGRNTACHPRQPSGTVRHPARPPTQ